jgi:HlyD family secretion protein
MRLRNILITVVLLSVLGGTAHWWWKYNNDQNQQTALTLYGNVDIREVNLAFKISERIETMHVREGERISAGALVAELEDERLRLAVERAEAQANAQQQVVARLQAGTRPQKIKKARADVEAALADYKIASITCKRVTNLARKELASQEDADRAKAACDAANARLMAAQETLDLAIAGPRQEDIESAQAELESLKSELALAKYDLSQTKLHAPADGIIRDRILEPGDMASPQQPVFTLALMNPVWVRAYLPEPDLGRVHTGAMAEIHTDSYPGKTYRGWIGYISSTAEFTPKTVETPRVRTDLVYQIRIYACNPQDELRLGMPATITIPLVGGETVDTVHSCTPSQNGTEQP